MSAEPEGDGRLGMTVAALVGGVALASVLVATGIIHFGWRSLGQVLRELGVSLPALTELGVAFLPDWGYLIGLGLLGVAIAASRLPRAGGLALLAGVVATSALVMLIGVGGFVAARGEVARFGGPTPPPAYAPGRAAQVADDVVEAVRRCVPRARSFQAPGGQTRWFFLYDGPGAPPAPKADAPYAEVHAHDAVVLLPSAAEDNTSISAEPLAFAPRWLDLSPGSLATSEARTLDWNALTGTNEVGMPVLRFPRVFDAGDGFSYALSLQRARLHCSEASTLLGPSDPFVDTLFQVRVHVFHGFDAARAADPTVPTMNQPVAELVTEVRR